MIQDDRGKNHGIYNWYEQPVFNTNKNQLKP